MNQIINNILIILVVSFLIYIVFSNLSSKEGMTNQSSTSTLSDSSILNGIAGNASGYAAQIKSNTIKLQDTFLISKYRKDYENIVINMDDYVNNLMLETVLNLNQKNPEDSLDKLSKLNDAKVALNNVMKFIDRTS
jgi:hypothetical protein